MEFVTDVCTRPYFQSVVGLWLEERDNEARVVFVKKFFEGNGFVWRHLLFVLRNLQAL